jgi:hypothetical protein
VAQAACKSILLRLTRRDAARLAARPGNSIDRLRKTQKQFRLEALAAGCTWSMARSANAAMTVLYRAGVTFRQPWKPPPLQPWEGPFADPHKRLPQHPEVATRRREEQRRYRERKRARKAAEIAGLVEASVLQSPSTGEPFIHDPCRTI